MYVTLPNRTARWGIGLTGVVAGASVDGADARVRSMCSLVPKVLRCEFTAIVVLVCALAPLSALATSAENVVIKASAVVQESPPKITLAWPTSTGAGTIYVFRKTDDATDWGPPIAGPLADTATEYQDTSVAVGTPYGYGLFQGPTEGYVYAGIKVPLVEDRGKIVLVVDDTYAASLASELARLEEDLVGDGWLVLRHDVDGTETVSDVKALIQAEYDADPENVEAVFLFGHVPVPYSGDLNPDGHPDHLGAWPADVFYGEMNGAWTDTTVNDTGAGGTRNDNVPGDGKYDQSSIPTTVELMVGRVDLFDMPAFALSEEELLRQYLDKDHAFRHKTTTAPARALVADNFLGNTFAQSGWRFSALVGAGNVTAGAWSSLVTDDYLLAYGCGPGTYTSASGIVSTSNYAGSTYRAMFQMLFGSYFGDWDNTNNLLRAPLCNPTYGLTSCWAGRPSWSIHHMGLGKPIGYGARLSTLYLYASGSGAGMVHIALMGDPTLRLQYVAPPSALDAIAVAGDVDLTWEASPDADILGYYVYRSADPGGPFTGLNADLVPDVSYTDTDPLVGESTYMVRAVRLEESASGTYYNASQGIFVSYSPRATPTVTAWPTASGITYGETLSDSTLTGGSASVDGTFVFNSPGTAPPAGTYTADVTFTPTDTNNYNSVDGSVDVPVAKGTPIVAVWPTASAIVYGQTLADSTLTGGSASVGGTFAFNSPGTAPSAGTHAEAVTFTPVDTVDYNTVAGTVSVTVYTPATITVQPQSHTVQQGATVYFWVNATGTSPLQYQWRRNGVNVSGATSAAHGIPSAQLSSQGAYTCRVWNAFGEQISEPATLTVNAPPVISVQPPSHAVYQWQDVYFWINATGSIPLHYQWIHDGVDIPGATSIAYGIIRVQPCHEGEYQCRVWNAFGEVVSEAGSLTVIPATSMPIITTQPVSRTVLQGTTAYIGLVATGSQPLRYQWMRDGTDIPGATAAVHGIPSAQSSHEGAYACRVSNDYGEVTSDSATLTVQPQK